MTPPGNDPTEQVFLESVAAYVTPAMQRHGFVVCSKGEGRGAGPSHSPHLTSARPRRLAGLRRPRGKVCHLAVGYEGEEGDEFWLWYFPGQRVLDVSWWEDVLPSDLPWKVGPSGPVDREQLRHRLRVLGQAISDAKTLAGW